MDNIGYAEITKCSAPVLTSNGSVLKFADSLFAIYFHIDRPEVGQGGWRM